MPTLEVNNFNIVLSVLGGWISLFGLVSYLCKEHFYLSEACEFGAQPALQARLSLAFVVAPSEKIRGPPLRLTQPQPSDIPLGGRGILAPCE